MPRIRRNALKGSFICLNCKRWYKAVEKMQHIGDVLWKSPLCDISGHWIIHTVLSDITKKYAKHCTESTTYLSQYIDF